jgi:hypothetical protein
MGVDNLPKMMMLASTQETQLIKLNINGLISQWNHEPVANLEAPGRLSHDG